MDRIGSQLIQAARLANAISPNQLVSLLRDEFTDSGQGNVYARVNGKV